jgi:hypothetical protein
MPLVVDLLGWIGAAALLLAYWMVSTRRAHGSAVSYQSLNLIGSVLVLVNSLYYGAHPSVAVNAVWIVIGLFALLTVRRDSAGV